MTAAEIAETLINGNIADAREAINSAARPAVLALDVLAELIICVGPEDIIHVPIREALPRLRRCLTGEP